MVPTENKLLVEGVLDPTDNVPRNDDTAVADNDVNPSVVVAPPLTVRPVCGVPPPIVEEAVAKIEARYEVPETERTEEEAKRV